MAVAILLDTNAASVPIYRYLVDAGHDVHVVGDKPDNALAKSADNYIKLDYSNVEAVTALVERLDADFLIPGCNDLSYETCAAISATRRFPGIDPVETVRILGNKQDFRQYAEAVGIPAPRQISEADARSAGAVIVKPADAYSGRGITALMAPSAADLAAAINQAKAFSRSGSCLIEEFVQGQLYSHSAFLGPDGIVTDFFVEEYGSVNPYAVDTSYVVPAFDPALANGVRAAIEKIARDLNLTAGLIHTQFIVDGDKFWIIEITRRCPGDLYSQLIASSTGFNYAENYTRPFLGEGFDGRDQAYRPVLRHTISVRTPQIFEGLQFRRAADIEMFVPLALTGEHIAASPFGRIGILFARADDAAALNTLLHTALNGELYAVLGQDRKTRS
ncbi:ATP-grasp domain-containing protein [Sphingomonas sp.]|uniref:ATP-grasp domain-containing protein n=1 Tax=Sphingomonas sp. TaxID=28214 RepID=UPI0028AF36FD|nr:ATP-grasp domain-containing protein [Sphingomonas sp.]